ncbi:gamma-butyrobetaine hydroxylase-like domain-containing protein [Rhodoblastus sp.]|uniref:gamma-butyrobetaine hydroxylase-like domain-containing protein n=1 Tax=Rhodoblastus sp. TaxID=1962975 RepID=UPI0035AE8112
MNDAHWPSELRLAEQGKVLNVTFESGEAYALTAEYLRVTSPSAEVQGHSPDERKTVGGKRNVAILAMEPVGNYAVILEFDDKHASGIYTWDYLHRLGAEHDFIWTGYLDELARKGLAR